MEEIYIPWNRGVKHWLYGKGHKEETRKKISLSLKLYFLNHNPVNKGKIEDEEFRKKVSRRTGEAMQNPQIRQLISSRTKEAMMKVSGEKLSYWKGKKRSFKNRKKISEGLKRAYEEGRR